MITYYQRFKKKKERIKALYESQRGYQLVNENTFLGLGDSGATILALPSPTHRPTTTLTETFSTCRPRL